jgi:hypothetical protein
MSPNVTPSAATATPTPTEPEAIRLSVGRLLTRISSVDNGNRGEGPNTGATNVRPRFGHYSLRR